MKYEDRTKLSNDPIPATASDTNGDVVPIPTLPFASIMNRVVVESPAVVLDTDNRGKALDDDAEYRVRSEDGDVVPIPTLPPVVAKYVELAEVKDVVEAYKNCEAVVDVAVK